MIQTIITRIKAFIRRIRKRDSVTNIVCQFEKTEKNLCTLGREKTAEGNACDVAARNMMSASNEAYKEAAKAQRVANKIHNLLND